ncbi:hypothetical protein BDW71DRAFT_194403 [Aspergillus fruticulosus]
MQLWPFHFLFLKAEEERKQPEEGRKQETELRRQAEERGRQERERSRPRTLEDIHPPTGRYCPLRLLPWTDCAARQQEIYESVRRYLQPTEEDARQLFAPLVALEDHSSEQNLQTYEWLAVEDHVHEIIAEPHQFYIHQVGGDTSTLLTIVEYKPPHELSVGSLQIAKPNTTPMEEPEKLKYNTVQLVGLMDVQLWVTFDDPGTLYYDLGDPTWRENARSDLHQWYSSFDSVRSQIFITESQQSAQSMECTSTEYSSSEKATSEYLPSSSPAESPAAKGPRVATRSGLGCAPLSDQPHREGSQDSDADPNTFTRQKRRFSEVASSPPTRLSARRTDMEGNQGRQSYQHHGGAIDSCCPNSELHISGRHDDRHPINAKTLVAPFKVTGAAHGYTIVGKATTSRRWKEVSSEADVYLFLGAIDLAKVYFLHSAGEIRHMLLMGWGGEDLSHLKSEKPLDHAISRSLREVRSSGIVHQDLRPENILWNAELNRALIIDFHRCTFDQQLMPRRPVSTKQLQCAPQKRKHEKIHSV